MINFFDCENDIINAIDEINSSQDYSEHCSYEIQSDNQLVLRWSAPSVAEVFDVMVDCDSLIVYDVDGMLVEEASYGDDVYDVIMSVYGYVRSRHF